MTQPVAVDAQGWMRKVERRLTLLERKPVGKGGGGAVTTIAVEDTTTLDLTLTGSPVTGYTIKGDVLLAPTSIAVTDTATIDMDVVGVGSSFTLAAAVSAVPVGLLTGPGTIAPALLPAPTPTPLTVTDTATVNMTLTGAGTAASPWNIKADVIGGSTPTPVVIAWNANFRDSTPLGQSVINKVGTKVTIDRFMVENATSLTLGTNGQVAAGTIPAGSRPTIEVRFPTSLNVSGNFMSIGQVLIATTGAITLQTNQPFTGVAAGGATWSGGTISWTAA